MKHRSILSIFLCLALLAGMLSGCGASEDTPSASVQPTETTAIELDEELQRAQIAGFIPDDWLEDMDATVTFREYSEITTQLIKLWDESRLDEWKEIVKLASDAADEMDREDGFLMLSYAWVMMGYSHDHVFGYIDESLQPEYDIWRDPELMDSQMKDLSWDYPYFPNALDEIVYDIFGANYMWGAVSSFPDVMSPVSGKTMFAFDENKSLRLGDPLTRDDAVRAVVRMADYCQVELDPDWADYVSIADVGGYNKGIITDELLNAKSNLPEVTQENLPATWRGSGLSTPKGNEQFHLHFRETDVKLLAENGFNFLRLFFDFGSMRYPHYNEAWGQVNRNELEELDQFLAWCIEYGIHLQISMEYYQQTDGNSKYDATMPVSEEEWAVTRTYWEMLAKRYADIPSKYLSFDLCNEIEPLNELNRGLIEFDTAINGIASVRDVIWNADPDRVLLYSFANGPDTKVVKAIAELGLAIGCHSYQPTTIVDLDWEYANTNPYADVVWPQPVFPMGKICEGQAPLTITGAISDTKLSFHIWTADGESSVEVFADGKKLQEFPLTDGVQSDQNPHDYYFYDILYSVEIPEGTQEITMWVRDGYARFDTIIIGGDGYTVTMMPSDTGYYLDQSEPLPLVINSDGTYTNTKNEVYDADRIYRETIEPYRTIAEQYKVGFMVNEFGSYGTGVYWDIDTITAYHETMLELMEKYEIGWCYCETYNVFPKHLIIQYGDKSQWEGATVDEVIYDYGDHTETIKVCRELLEVFRKHNLNQ